MFKHNLLISFRNFQKHKTSFLINIIGLSTGLAGVLFIYLWVADEMSVDKFHEKEDRLYQFFSNYPVENEILTLEGSPLLMTKTIVEDFPEVESAVAVSQEFCSPTGILSFEDTSQKCKGIMASNDFFKVFSFELLFGVEDEVLNHKNKVVLSEDLARKLFDAPENAIGKGLEWNYQWDDGVEQFLVTVSGVFKPLPSNSTMQFEVVGHADLLVEADRWAGEWNGSYVYNYLVLQEGADVNTFNTKIEKYLSTKTENAADFSSFVQKFSDRYLHQPYENGKQVGGRIGYVKLLSVIALFMLCIACINFVNLATAQGSRKMKEIGVKKSLGANKKMLAWQFLSESVLVVFFSLMAASLLVFLLMPQFNLLTGKQVALSFDIEFVARLVGLVALTGVFAGFYPAIYLSGFNPLTVLKGKLSSKTGAGQIRKGLVVFQFSLSVILIFGVMVISKQIDFVMNKNLGYNKNNLISFEMGSNNDKPMTFISELNNLTGVESASFMNGSILINWDNSNGYSWNGDKSFENVDFQAPRVGYGFIETMGMELMDGRDFSAEYNDTHHSIILNESAVKLMGIENPVGEILSQGPNGDYHNQIIGVVNDFHYGSLHESMKPLILRFREHGRNVVLRMTPGAEKTALANIEKLFEEFQPGYPFDYSYIDTEYQKLYNAESRVAGLSNYFALLAILISCLGLFGLATFTAERRAKEIGIRKVMGSSVYGIVKLLSTDFTRMVLVAIAVGLPLAYWGSTAWLRNFAYTIDLQWWYFIATASSVLLIAWLTVGLQTLKAARINPIQFLRDE